MLIPIDDALIERMITQARSSPRRRAIHRFHEHPDPVQRMLNAMEPDTYVRPHQHAAPLKVEAFIILRGRAACFEYDAAGNVLAACVMGAGEMAGVEVVPGSWHSVLCLESGTCLYEIIEGPYDAATHKQFAEWSPAEEDEAAGQAWNAKLRVYLDHNPSPSGRG